MTLQRKPLAKIGKKKPKCKWCREEFIRVKPMQKCCDVDCAIAWAKNEQVKRDCAPYAKSKPRKVVHDKGWWMKKAVTVYNRWIVKVRDANEPCISSGRLTAVQWQCGHYMPSTHSAIRFDEDNTHKQSSEDNLYRSGNLTEYRIRLIDKIGLERVERLEGPHDQIKYSIDDLKSIHATYSQRLKDAGVSAS